MLHLCPRVGLLLFVRGQRLVYITCCSLDCLELRTGCICWLAVFWRLVGYDLVGMYIILVLLCSRSLGLRGCWHVDKECRVLERWYCFSLLIRRVRGLRTWGGRRVG